ncbi:MAG: PH domain-containing protein [Candidatus Saccharimonadales bacterium]
MDEVFDGQREGEEVLLVFRRHIIALRKGFYSILIPFFIASLPSLFFPGEFLYLYTAIGGLVLGLFLFFYHWIGWYFTLYILTNQRLRQSTQTGLFGKSVIDLPVSKIQNISYTIPGLSGEMFKFGTIVIQTYVGDLILDMIDHPARVYNKLQDVASIATADQQMDTNEEVDR